jgi:hypothetical protein
VLVHPPTVYLSKRYPHGPRPARAGFSYDKRDATHAHGIILHVRKQGCCLSRKAHASGRAAGPTLLLLVPNTLLLAFTDLCHDISGEAAVAAFTPRILAQTDYLLL